MKELSADLTPILKAWKFDQQSSVRRLRTAAGREVLQVRLPLGIEQYEIDGRPDGLRPRDCESWFEFHRNRAGNAPWSFHLAEDEFEQLHQESLLYYYRYVVFFQIGEYRLCARDTRRNLDVVDFVVRYAPPEQAARLEQYRPYILHMHVMAQSLHQAHEEKDLPGALRRLREGTHAVRKLAPLPQNAVFRQERQRALRNLAELRARLRKQLPPSPQSTLRRQLAKAVRRENYEEAARLRDEIARLKGLANKSGEHGSARSKDS
jgi:hypothetical protein